MNIDWKLFTKWLLVCAAGAIVLSHMGFGSLLDQLAACLPHWGAK